MRGIRDGMNVGLKRQWGQRQVSYALPNGVEPIVVMDFKNGVYTWDGATIDPADALEGFDPAFVSADGMLVGDTYLPRSTAALTALMGDPHAIVLDTVTTGIPNFEVLFSYVSHEGGSTHCQAYKAGDPQSLIIYQPAVDAFSGGEWPEALSRVMSFSNVAENAILALIFNATTWANYAINATSSPETNIVAALATADPGDTGTMSTSESAYTNYARQNIARTTSGFTAPSGGSTAFATPTSTSPRAARREPPSPTASSASRAAARPTSSSTARSRPTSRSRARASSRA
jgi:hypothetical protein